MPKTKAELLHEFEEMAALEAQARDMYNRTAHDPSVQDATVRNVFAKISKEEEAHVKIVERIQQIIKNTL